MRAMMRSRVFMDADDGALMPQSQGPICPEITSFGAWHNCPTMERTHLQNELKRRREELGMSQRDLSLRAGLNDSAVKKIESGSVRNPRSDSLLKIASALGCTLADLLGTEQETPAPGPEAFSQPPVAATPAPRVPDYGPTEVQPERVVSIPAISQMPRDVPVYGVAVGGDDADFEFNGQIVDYVRRPPGLIGVEGAFGIYVIGTSMDPRYEEGDLVYVHPGRPARPGDDVIIEMYDGHEGRSGHCYVKRLLKKAGGAYICRQYNPPRDDLAYPIERVKKVHRIMTAAELMSA